MRNGLKPETKPFLIALAALIIFCAYAWASESDYQEQVRQEILYQEMVELKLWPAREAR